MSTEASDTAIDAFIDLHECIKAMPEVSTRILNMLRDPNFQMRQLLRLIKQDAAIAARILKVVNSAAYARTNRITELDRATVYLGVNTVKEIVVATTVESLCKPAAFGKYTTRDLWEHSVGVAVLSREFALRSKAIDPDLAFLAGILHDIGLLLSAQGEPTTTEEIFTEADDPQIPFVQIEKSYFGFHHCQLGNRLAVAWQLPDEVAAAAMWHHSPRLAPANHRQICAHVFIADTLCAASGVGFPLTCSRQKSDDEMFKLAGLAREEAEDVMQHFKVLLRLHLS